MFGKLAFLVVDDDPIALVVAETILGAAGAGNVVTAESGSEALAKLAAGQINCILLDLNMPHLDGLGFMREAARRGFSGSVILVSGEDEAILRSAAGLGKVLGIDVLGTIRKPLRPDALAGLVASTNRSDSEKTDQRGVNAGDAVRSGELLPYYQPQFDAADETLKGFEALIRVRAVDGKIHGPGKVFGTAMGEAELLTTSMRIASRVLDDVAGWRRGGMEFRVAINFDARVIETPGISHNLLEEVERRGIAPNSICVELTETSLPRDVGGLIEALTRLRMRGFHVSIDDYGTGGSNFELLRACPFTELKLDRTILSAATTEAPARRFLHTATDMAHDLGLTVVAEGVETAEELALVRNAKVDIVQGYLFARPYPAEEAVLAMRKALELVKSEHRAAS